MREIEKKGGEEKRAHIVDIGLNRFKCYFSLAAEHLTLSQCLVEEHSDNDVKRKRKICLI